MSFVPLFLAPSPGKLYELCSGVASNNWTWFVLSLAHWEWERESEYYASFPVCTRNKKLRNLFDIPTEREGGAERERRGHTFPPKVKLSNWAMRTRDKRSKKFFVGNSHTHKHITQFARSPKIICVDPKNQQLPDLWTQTRDTTSWP